MFRSIGGVINKKKSSLIKEGEKNHDINFVFDKFLSQYFSEYKELFKWEASYDSKNSKVIINTGSKLIAGELSLKIKELSRLLREANLRVIQIVIS